MKKAEKYIYFACAFILVGVLSAGVTYIILNNKEENKVTENNNTENNDSVAIENSIKLDKTYELEDKIFQEYRIVLNNKEQILKIEYSYTFDENEGYLVTGVWNQNNFYHDAYRSESAEFIPEFIPVCGGGDDS